MRRTGVVSHMLSSLDQLGRVGYIAIADSAEEADALSRHVETTLTREAQAAATAPTQRLHTPGPRNGSAAVLSR